MLSVSNSKPMRTHPAALSLASPRVATGFPLSSPRAMSTQSPRPTGEGLDKWFADFKNFEDTLGEMAMAAEEPKFKEELGTIEQWFRLLAESEQTATLYTLLQTLNLRQIKFLMAVLQQMVGAGVAENSARQNLRSSPRPPSLNLGTPNTTPFPTAALPHERQEIIMKHTEESASWANMVNTPIDVMFQKSSSDAKSPDSASLNMAMLTKMGFSTEAQMMAIKLVMSGLVKPLSSKADEGVTSPPPAPEKPSKPRARSPAVISSNWRSGPPSSSNSRYPGSALRSSKNSGGKSAGLKSSGLKSSGGLSTESSGTTPKEEDVDPVLLEDVPAWLKSLRLHKYTACFEGLTWREIIELDEAEMEKRGVVALGARRRLTKTSEVVKAKMGIPLAAAPGPASATVPATVAPDTPTKLPTVPHSAAP